MATIQSNFVRELVRNRDLLFGFVLALTRNHEAAEEVFQEVSVAVLEEAARGAAPRDFLPWARALARHRVADYYRARTKDAARERLLARQAEVVSRAFEEHQDAAAASQTHLQYLRECLALLAGRARQIMEARYRHHLGLSEISEIVGWKENAVKVALSKARKVLAECVSRKFNAAAKGNP